MTGRYSRRTFLKLTGQGGAMVTGAAVAAGIGLSVVAGTVVEAVPKLVPEPVPTKNPPTTPNPTMTPARPIISPPQALPTNVPDGQSPDGRTGTQLDKPYEKDGIIVISKNHWVSREFQPCPRSAVDRKMAEPAQQAYDEMVQVAKSAGITLVLRSGYRDYDFQQVLYRRSLAEDGEQKTTEYLAKPGQSEHQTGLVADIYDGRTWGLAFERTKTYDWLQNNAYKFGFVLRYLKDREDVTGYLFEAWHYRWIGVDHARQFGPYPSMTIEDYLGIR